jgi:hypothetical protein
MNDDKELIAALGELIEKTEAIYEKSGKTDGHAGLMTAIALTLKGVLKNKDVVVLRTIGDFMEQMNKAALLRTSFRDN